MYPDYGNMYSNMKPFFLNSFLSQKKINSPDACRLCLRVEGVMTHYNSEMAGTVDLAGQIFECLGISFPIEMTQKELVQICHRCVYAVSRFYEFKMRCQELHILQRRFQRRSPTPSETTEHSVCSILPGSERSLLYADGSDLETDWDVNCEWPQNEEEETADDELENEETADDELENEETADEPENEETADEPENNLPDKDPPQCNGSGKIAMPSLDVQLKSKSRHEKGVPDLSLSPPNLDIEHHLASSGPESNNELGNTFNRDSKADGENKLVPCSICKKKFKGGRFLKRHMSVHNKSKIKCEECGKLYKSHSGYTQHKQTHSGKSHPCESCNKVFKSQLSLLCHSRMIHQSKKGKETKVSKRLSKKRNLENEENKNVTWTCFGCKLVFDKADKFYSHFKTCYYKSYAVSREDNYNPKKINLEVPRISFHSSKVKIPKKESKKQEAREAKKEARTLLCCQECTNKYTNIDDLMEHEISVHKLLKVFTCVCAKTFTYKAYSVEHEKTHKPT